uniref:Snake toxin/toxin-like domain-containing protein n=1 Tax=Strix occidentalis caurina TaxID=311401 RepID=A0A8D0ESK4_STROC
IKIFLKIIHCWPVYFEKGSFSLMCFTCQDASSNIHCLSTTTCSEHEKYCLTTYSTRGFAGGNSA